MKYLVSVFFLFAISFKCVAQDVYKTPSGKRYHLSSCRMVENVSRKLVGIDAITTFKLTPCKICKPPLKSELGEQLSSEDKSVGTATSVRCKGYTKQGTRCKHQTRLANGYCYQHTKQNSEAARSSQNTTSNSSTSLCGAKTKTGKRCKRKVKGGGFCYQHD